MNNRIEELEKELKEEKRKAKEAKKKQKKEKCPYAWDLFNNICSLIFFCFWAADGLYTLTTASADSALARVLKFICCIITITMILLIPSSFRDVRKSIKDVRHWRTIHWQ